MDPEQSATTTCHQRHCATVSSHKLISNTDQKVQESCMGSGACMHGYDDTLLWDNDRNDSKIHIKRIGVLAGAWMC